MASTNKTSKLELSQYISTDKPGYLTDYNTDMARIDAYVGQVTRTATVVVGSAASGYTAEQVDVLIPLVTENCTEYLREAINRLPACGGEIKLMEGDYSGEISWDSAAKHIHLNGTGANCTVKATNAVTVPSGGKVSISNIAFETSSASARIISCNSGAVEIVLANVEFQMPQDGYAVCSMDSNAGFKLRASNCSNLKILGKSAENWYNIVVDGTASYEDYSVGFSDSSSKPRYGTYTPSRTCAVYALTGNNLNIRGQVWATNGLEIKSHFGSDKAIYLTTPSMPTGRRFPEAGLFTESAFTTGFTCAESEYLVAQIVRNELFLYWVVRNIAGSGNATYERIKNDTLIVSFNVSVCI